MLSSFSWLGKLLEHFSSLIPRPLIIKSSHGGVLYLFGRWPLRIGPGWWPLWPIFMDYETCPMVRQYVDGHTRLETRDGIAVDIGFVVCYEVRDQLVFLANNENPYSVIDDCAASAIFDHVLRRDRSELRADFASITKTLTRATAKNLRGTGVKVHYTRLRDFSKTQVVSLAGAPLVNLYTQEPSA